MSQNAKARGVPAMTADDCDADMQDKIYAFFDAVDGSADNSVSLADCAEAMNQIGAKCREIMGN